MMRFLQGAKRFVKERVVRALQRSSVAVLVDAENVSAKYFPQVIESMRREGRVRDVRIYGSTALLNSEPWSVIAAAYDVRRVPCGGRKQGKNSADIRMTVDAMDLMASKQVVTFAIVSDDTDFIPLARRLHEEGRRVVGVGRLNHTAKYRKAFDEFVTLGRSAKVAEGAFETAAVSFGAIGRVERIRASAA